VRTLPGLAHALAYFVWEAAPAFLPPQADLRDKDFGATPSRAGWKKPNVAAVKFDLPAYSVPAKDQPSPAVTTVLRVLSSNHPRQAHTIINYLIDSVRRVGLACPWAWCAGLAWPFPWRGEQRYLGLGVASNGGLGLVKERS
jgi:hypothetical protein